MKHSSPTEPIWVRFTLIGIALGFMFLFLVLPLAAVFTEALRKGFGAYLEALKEPDAWSAIWLTIVTAAIVVPLNPGQDRYGPHRAGLCTSGDGKAMGMAG